MSDLFVFLKASFIYTCLVLMKEGKTMIPSLRKNSKKIQDPKHLTDKLLTDEEKHILELLKTTKEDIDSVHNKYEYATEPCIIDSYIYELKALHLRYEYLLNEAKKFCS